MQNPDQLSKGKVFGMGCLVLLGLTSLLMSCSSSDKKEETLNIAIVNNADLVRLKALSPFYEAKHPNIKLRWLTLEENMLRQRITVDTAVKSGQFDVISIGSYEVPMWSRQGWLTEINNPVIVEHTDDYIDSIKKLVIYHNQLYTVPFYGEGVFTFYRKDLVEKAGLKMPDYPTWSFIEDVANRLNNPSGGIYGLCMRGKAGWGENVSLLTAMGNSFGARLFDEKWHPQFNTPEWEKTLTTYVRLMRQYGPPGSSVNGFSENLALFSAGKCAVWIDSSVAVSFVTSPKTSAVSDKTGFAFAPDAGLGKSANWLFSWGLAVPAGSHNSKEAQKFIAWATSPEYRELVAKKYGWSSVPPGTSKSLYANPQYQKDVPFSKATLMAIEAADPIHPTLKPVPYTGIQFATIPEFQGIGSQLGRHFAAALVGTETPKEALNLAQINAEREMTDAGYIK